MAPSQGQGTDVNSANDANGPRSQRVLPVRGSAGGGSHRGNVCKLGKGRTSIGLNPSSLLRQNHNTVAFEILARTGN